MKTKKIKQSVVFNTSPKMVYDLIMEAKHHSRFTGNKVTMSKKEKGKFEVFGGYCHGINTELVEGKKIVQHWHFAEKGWPEDHFSVCTFEFKKDPKGTKLSFTQEAVPEHVVNQLKSGWKEYYWQPMKAYLKELKK